MNSLIPTTLQAISNIQTIEEAKEGYDKLRALVSYFCRDYEKAFEASVAMIEYACRGGELIQEMQEKGELATQGGDRKSNLQPASLKLSDFDMEYTQSSRWQLMASVPRGIREIHYTKLWEENKEVPNKKKTPSLAGVASIAKKSRHEENVESQRIEIAANNFVPPTGLFNTISIDPPWPYGTKYDAAGRRAANPYPEMSLSDIAAIQLPAAEDCILWLWTTHRFMRHSFTILDTWGFRDVVIVTWVKDKMGLGSWLRSQTEFCIMAVKGKPLIDLTNQITVIYGELREHSRKPDSFYEMVDSLCVGYKLDYFSREQREGWMSYGNDTGRF